MNDALVIRGLQVSRGTMPVLRGIDLDVAPGEICALMGESGAGKSTVLRTVVALQAFDAGRITLGDVALGPGAVPPESRLRALRRKVGMVFQAHALFEHLSALDNVTIAPIHALGWTREKAEGIATRLLGELGVAHRADALPRQLSGGRSTARGDRARVGERSRHASHGRADVRTRPPPGARRWVKRFAS